MFVSTERDNANSGVSRPSPALRPGGHGIGLTATHEWNLTADLPAVAANSGLEAITWIPDSFLTSHGFFDEHTGAAYDPAAYPGHGDGLFFVGLEANGTIYAYALDHRRRIHPGRHDRQRVPRRDGPPVRAGDGPPLGGVRRHLRRPHRDPRRDRRREFAVTGRVRAAGRHAGPQQRGLRDRAAVGVRRGQQAGVLVRRQRRPTVMPCAAARSTARRPTSTRTTTASGPLTRRPPTRHRRSPPPPSGRITARATARSRSPPDGGSSGSTSAPVPPPRSAPAHRQHRGDHLGQGPTWSRARSACPRWPATRRASR